MSQFKSNQIIVVRLSTNERLFKRYFSHTFLRWICLVIRYWTPNILFQATILTLSQYLVLEYINSLLSSNDIMANVLRKYHTCIFIFQTVLNTTQPENQRGKIISWYPIEKQISLRIEENKKRLTIINHWG